MKLKANKKVAFDDFLHCYQCGGKTLMGVTTLMAKHHLSPEYGEIDQEVLAGAATRGSAVHKLLEDYDNGKNLLFRDIEYNGKVVLTKEMLRKNWDAYKAMGFNVLASEYLVSDNKSVASSIDKVLYVDELTVDLADIKTTSELHISALEWQLGIYAYLFRKANPKIAVGKCWGIHIRNGVCKVREITPVSADKVEALLKAEAEGRIYEEEKVNATSVIDIRTLNAIVRTDLKIADLKSQIKELEDGTALAKEGLYQYMVENNVRELECEGGKIVLKSPTQRQGVDSKKLQSEYPEVYRDCLKVSEVKGSITFKSK